MTTMRQGEADAWEHKLVGLQDGHPNPRATEHRPGAGGRPTRYATVPCPGGGRRALNNVQHRSVRARLVGHVGSRAACMNMWHDHGFPMGGLTAAPTQSPDTHCSHMY